MHSVMIVLLGIAGMAFGWFIYSKFIAEKIFKLDPDFQTPAHEFNDGVDFVPTNRFVLWGHHFTSVAGAAPMCHAYAPSHAERRASASSSCSSTCDCATQRAPKA